jgi:hypothetical protein
VPWTRLLALCFVLSCALPVRAYDVAPPRSPFVREPSAERPATRFLRDERASREQLTLYLQREVNPVLGPGGSAETGLYQPLCALPCELGLRPGSYVFGLAAGTGPTIKTREPLVLRGGEQVLTRYDSRRVLRAAGWAVLIVGVLGGGALIVNGHAHDLRARFITGNVLVALSLGSGLWMMNVPDRASAHISR